MSDADAGLSGGPERILFWGTSDFAVPGLLALDVEGFQVVGVVTRPDRPAGRGRRPTPSPVRKAAEELKLPVLTPDRPVGEAFLDEIRALEPDLSVVIAYGHILRREVLDVPPLGSINVHASLLPELRGAAPINWAVARGYQETGITVMRMVEAMDAGPILHQVKEPIHPELSASELWACLKERSAEALIETLTLMSLGQLEEREQDHDRATFAPKVDRETARIDWDRPPEEIAWHVRGMDAVPGAWTMFDGEPVKLFRPTSVEVTALPDATVDHDRATDAPGVVHEPGTVIAADTGQGLVVATKDGGAVRFGEVQPPGKRRMAALAWINGRGVEAGRRFE